MICFAERKLPFICFGNGARPRNAIGILVYMNIHVSIFIDKASTKHPHQHKQKHPRHIDIKTNTKANTNIDTRANINIKTSYIYISLGCMPQP